MSDWRIEPAVTGRGKCKVCGKAILQGEQRFGQDGGTTASWFHLECAADGAPRAFAKFERRAARLMKKRAPAAPATQRVPAELVAALGARRGARAARAVLADWLQERGDPWGTLLTLTDTGHREEAAAFAKQHAQRLTGGFGELQWKDGFVSGASLKARRPEVVEGQLRELLSHRPAVLLSELSLQVPPSRALLDAVVKGAPPSLHTLRLWPGDDLSGLSLPRLTTLEISTPHGQRVRGELRGLLDCSLPSLRQLTVDGELMTPEFTEAFCRAPLARQLTRLEVGEISSEVARILVAHRRSFVKLKSLGWRGRGPAWSRLHATFTEQTKAFRAEEDAALARGFEALREVLVPTDKASRPSRS